MKNKLTALAGIKTKLLLAAEGLLLVMMIAGAIWGKTGMM